MDTETNRPHGTAALPDQSLPWMYGVRDVEPMRPTPAFIHMASWRLLSPEVRDLFVGRSHLPMPRFAWRRP